jgi:hypothetical protein
MHAQFDFTSSFTVPDKIAETIDTVATVTKKSAIKAFDVLSRVDGEHALSMHAAGSLPQQRPFCLCLPTGLLLLIQILIIFTCVLITFGCFWLGKSAMLLK